MLGCVSDFSLSNPSTAINQFFFGRKKWVVDSLTMVKHHFSPNSFKPFEFWPCNQFQEFRPRRKCQFMSCQGVIQSQGGCSKGRSEDWTRSAEKIASVVITIAPSVHWDDLLPMAWAVSQMTILSTGNRLSDVQSICNYRKSRKPIIFLWLPASCSGPRKGDLSQEVEIKGLWLWVSQARWISKSPLKVEYSFSQIHCLILWLLPIPTFLLQDSHVHFAEDSHR